MDTRAVVAMAGTFGYELDLGKLSADEKEEIREQIHAYHKYAELIQKGDYFRLTDPFEEEIGAWAFVSEDKREVLLNLVMLEVHGYMTSKYVKLQGLDADAMYREQTTGKVYSGAALMDAGLPVPMDMGEYQAKQIFFKFD